MGHGAMGHGATGHGAMGHGAKGHGATEPGAAAQLMTPEEQAAMREKMRAAKTPEARQKLAEANRAEMQQRAKDKGISLPEGQAGHRQHGSHPGHAVPSKPPAK